MKQGYGFKRGGLRNKAYKKRWFVLTKEGEVLYFEHNDSTAPLGAIDLRGASLAPHKTDDFKLIINTESREWGLRFENKKVCEEWKAFLQSTIDLLGEKSQLNAINMLHLDEDKQLKALAGLGKESFDSVTVTCFTWNMASRLPDIRQLTFLKQFNTCDILAFGIQEYQAVSSSITHQHEKNQRPPLDIWNAMLLSTLGPEYTLVATKSMGAMAISCLVHSHALGYVKVLSMGSVPCGIGNVLYNKV